MQSTQSNMIRFKVSFGDQIRRASLTSHRYQELESLIRSLFSLPVETILIKYKDDEDDLISLSSDIELSTAIHTVPLNGLLRLIVTLQPQAFSPSPPILNFPIPDKQQFKCLKQNYHRMKFENPSEAKAYKLQFKQIKQAYKRQKKEQKALFQRDYQASFVPLRAILPSIPSSTQSVSLTITNTGQATWPEGTQLVRVGKFQELSNPIKLPSSVVPAASVTLTIHASISDGGSHFSKWRLVLPDGVKFGTKCVFKTCEFSSKAECHKKRKLEKRRFSQGIMQLRQMGFQGRQVCSLMGKYHGDVERVASELLARSNNEKCV